MAKQRKKRTSTILKADQDKPLPTAAERAKRIENLTGQTDTSKTETSAGRPKKKHGRKTFTTLLDPDYKRRLKLLAMNKDAELHDLIHEAITRYLEAEE